MRETEANVTSVETNVRSPAQSPSSQAIESKPTGLPSARRWRRQRQQRLPRTCRSERVLDGVAVTLLLVFTAISEWELLVGGTVTGMDNAILFYPTYGYLGERLRSGDIPLWNPYQLAGAPFAADPQSGWTYLPAMLLFTALPLSTAINSLQFLNPFLAGLWTYALGRTLGMSFGGALLAATAYAYAGFLYRNNVCCLAEAGIYVWLPLVLLGVERAIRASAWPNRGLWWGVAGLGLSQILAVWLGQGAYYALLVVGGYVTYRTALFPPGSGYGVKGRAGRLVLHGGAVLLCGFVLAAAGILPRLEYNALSSLARGYPPEELGHHGWSIRDWGRLLTPGFWYVGGVTLVLALVAPVLARSRFATPFFAALSLGTLILAGGGTTLLHSVAYLLPRFAQLHTHLPERIMMVFYLGPALLAGAAFTSLAHRGRRAAFAAFLPALATLLLVNSTLPIRQTTLFALIAATGFVAVYPILPKLRPVLSTLVLLVLFADLMAAGKTAIAERQVASFHGADDVMKVDFDQYYEPSASVKFLQAKSTGGEVFRFFGYAPETRGGLPYTVRWPDQETTALEVPNRATLSHLHDIQGYNAVQLARYRQYLDRMNAWKQNYHDAQVSKHALTSPLLGLLNLRYIIVPRTLDLQISERAYPIAYRDRQQRVVENRDALPRAWIVHEARQAQPGEMLDLLTSYDVDPKTTALLEEPPPRLSPPNDTTTDRVGVTRYEPERIELKATTGAAGLLVLSEVYYPAWKAYVDEDPVPLYRANYLFRAVPLPDGEHTVELRYESMTLKTGLAISLAAYAALALLFVAVSTRHPKRLP
jgi:hypothetical protein